VTLAVDPGAVRTEHDLLGELDIAPDACYGIHTACALASFPISGVPLARFTEPGDDGACWSAT
jgi:aspartate ammonia-lyase